MGCSSACRIFEEFSTCIHWILIHKFYVMSCVHYADDYLLIAPSAQQCGNHLKILQILSERIGLPLAEDKTFQPAQIMGFLGFDSDSVLMEARLSEEKISDYRNSIDFLLFRFLHTQTNAECSGKTAVGL